MIPISYHNTVNTDYDDFVKAFKVKVESWLRKGYIGNRHKLKSNIWKKKYSWLNNEQKQIFKTLFPGLSRSPANEEFCANEWILDTSTREFLEYIKNDVGVDVLLNNSMAELKKLNNDIGGNACFQDMKVKGSTLYRNIYHAFVEIGYVQNIKKDKFVEAVGIKVCPYCNRTFIQNVAIGKKSVVKGELDHFLNKDDFPYFSICKYNLVPSCPFCNHGKGNENKPNLQSPYDLTDANGIKFRMTITGHGFPNMKRCASAITIHVDDNGNGGNSMQDNIDQFHLKELYQIHTDYAAEIYYMGKLKHNSKYLNSTRKRLRKLHLGITKEELERLFLGFYTDPSAFGNRPLAKFRYDLAVDERVI